MSDDSTQLWNYALALYAQEGVADACLVLQDECGADICELLWICWLASQGLTLADDAEQALAPIRHRQATLTHLLRERRRSLKSSATPGSPLAEWRLAIKAAELAAERGTLRQLQGLTQHRRIIRPLTQDDAPLIVRLASHLSFHSQTATHHLTTLIAHIDTPITY